MINERIIIAGNYWGLLFFFGDIPGKGKVKVSIAFKLLSIALGKMLIASGIRLLTLLSFISFSPFARMLSGMEKLTGFHFGSFNVPSPL